MAGAGKTMKKMLGSTATKKMDAYDKQIEEENAASGLIRDAEGHWIQGPKVSATGKSAAASNSTVNKNVNIVNHVYANSEEGGQAAAAKIHPIVRQAVLSAQASKG